MLISIVNGFCFNIFFVTTVHLYPMPKVTNSPKHYYLYFSDDHPTPHSQYSVCSAAINNSIATLHPTSKGHAFNAMSTIWKVFPPPTFLHYCPFSIAPYLFQKNCIQCTIRHRKCIFDANNQSSCKQMHKIWPTVRV